MGTFFLPVEVTNSGATDCALTSGQVSLALGQPEAVVATLQGQIKDEPDVVTIEPGETATLRATFAIDCQRQESGSGETIPIFLDLEGSQVAVDGPGAPDWTGVCQGITFTADPKLSGQDTGRGPYVDLSAAADPEAQLEDGYVDYTIVLTNHGEKTLVFDDCPGYTETLFERQTVVQEESYVLNCSPVKEIAPGGAASFQMRIPVNDPLSDDVAVTWTMHDGPSVAADLDMPK